MSPLPFNSLVEFELIVWCYAAHAGSRNRRLPLLNCIKPGNLMRISKGIVSFILAGSCVIASACSNNQVPPQPPPPPSFVSHTVQYPGETLASIAKWYTGASSNWQRIRDANPELNPKKIRIGTTIQIPQAIALRSDAPPRPKVSPTEGKGHSVNPSQEPSYNTVSQDTYAVETAEVASNTQPAAELPLPPSETDLANSATLGTEENSTVAFDTSAPVADSDRASPAMPLENDFDSNQAALSAPMVSDTQEISPNSATEAPSMPNSPQDAGLMKGILEAVGNAALDAKKAPPAQ